MMRQMKLHLMLAALLRCAVVGAMASSFSTSSSSSLLHASSQTHLLHEEKSTQVPNLTVHLRRPGADEFFMTYTPAVSTTVQCVINLTIQYFFVFTFLIIVKTFNELRGIEGSKSNLQRVAQSLISTVSFCPIVSILFVGVRMRAIQLASPENPANHDLPQAYVQTFMQICAWSIFFSLVLKLVTSLCVSIPVDMESGEELHEEPTLMEKVLKLGSLAVLIGMYSGLVVVCVGAYSMVRPEKLGEDLPVAPALSCTMYLCYLYCFVFLVNVLNDNFGSKSPLGPKEACNIACSSVAIAPMFCILFLAARMRAQTMPGGDGNPQAWAQNCFYLCTFSIIIQSLMILMSGFVFHAQVSPGACDGDVKFKLANSSLDKVFQILRWLILVSTYGGAAAVLTSVFTIEAEGENVTTPAVSTTLLCVMNLALQFFFVYIVVATLIVLRSFSMDDRAFSGLLTTFLTAKDTVAFAPMLSVLFLACRMRALQMSGGEGAPQKWARDCMYLATWSVLIQFIMVLISPFLMGIGGGKSSSESLIGGGGPQSHGKSRSYNSSRKTVNWAPMTLEVCRLAVMAAMYGGAVGVIVAIVEMTPQKLLHSEAFTVGGVGVPTPPTPPPAE